MPRYQWVVSLQGKTSLRTEVYTHTMVLSNRQGNVVMCTDIWRKLVRRSKVAVATFAARPCLVTIEKRELATSKFSAENFSLVSGTFVGSWSHINFMTEILRDPGSAILPLAMPKQNYACAFQLPHETCAGTFLTSTNKNSPPFLGELIFIFVEVVRKTWNTSLKV